MLVVGFDIALLAGVWLVGLLIAGGGRVPVLAIVNTLIMHPDDMKELSIPEGGTVTARSDWGEAVFQCKQGKVPAGMIFVPYGPPTCKLMGQSTDGTGMPLSKGWEVEILPHNN